MSSVYAHHLALLYCQLFACFRHHWKATYIRLFIDPCLQKILKWYLQSHFHQNKRTILFHRSTKFCPINSDYQTRSRCDNRRHPQANEQSSNQDESFYFCWLSFCRRMTDCWAQFLLLNHDEALRNCYGAKTCSKLDVWNQKRLQSYTLLMSSLRPQLLQ